MPNVTVCTNCGSLYEAGSEEQAHEPSMVISGPATHTVRCCPDCLTHGFAGTLIRALGIADPHEAELIRQRMIDADDDGLEDLGD